jgi:hypothetical protein
MFVYKPAMMTIHQPVISLTGLRSMSGECSMSNHATERVRGSVMVDALNGDRMNKYVESHAALGSLLK